MKKYLVLTIMLCTASAPAATYYFQKPDLTTLPDTSRILVYDAGTNSDKNITGALLKSVMKNQTTAWGFVTGKPSVFSPSVHGSSHGSGGIDPLSLAAGQVTGLATVATSGSYGDLTGRPAIPSAATDISYTNPTYTTVAAALDQLLYVAPGSPSVSGGGTYETGQTITSVVLNWTITLGNKPLTSQSIDNGIGAISTALRTYTHGSQAITANRTYTVSITDGVTPRTGSTTVSFSRRRHWGASTIPLASMTSADILALASNEFSTSHTKAGVIYNCTGGLYPTFAFVATAGTLTAVKVGGLSFTDYSYRTISHTNASGNTTNYYVYQFNNLQTGASITVDWD